MKLLVNRKEVSSYEDIKDELVEYDCSCKPDAEAKVITGADHSEVILGWANGWNSALRDWLYVAAQKVVSAQTIELASDWSPLLHPPTLWRRRAWKRLLISLIALFVEVSKGRNGMTAIRPPLCLISVSGLF